MVEKLSSSLSQGPLANFKVIEIGSFIAGPFCGQLLADLGAEVIKIEPPKSGDTMRTWGSSRTPKGDSLWWPVIGRNKKSMTLDLRSKKGQEILKKLVAESDVLLENFRPGTLNDWNLSVESLSELNKNLIIAQVSGYGQTGPYSKKPGFGSVAESISGLRNLTGYPHLPPTRVGISIGDSLAGLFATVGVLASLVARENELGCGQNVDVAITESILAVMESIIPEYTANGAVRERSGPILPKLAPSNIYPTIDGNYVLIAANADKLFKKLARAIQKPELIEDIRYSTHLSRGENQAELDKVIENWTITKSTTEILNLMTQEGIPAGPVNDVSDVVADPHFLEREAIVQVPHEELGHITMQGAFPKLSKTPATIRWAGVKLGEHTDIILRERLGYTHAAIKSLRDDKII